MSRMFSIRCVADNNMKFSILICFAILAVNQARSDCFNGNTTLMAYQTLSIFTKTKDYSIKKINDLKGNYQAGVLINQNLPILCKQLLEKMNNVNYLYITLCGVKEVETGAFKGSQIVSLEFDENKLTAINVGTYEDMTDLEDLTFTQNKITTIDNAAFRNLPNLEEISITREKITTVSHKWFVNCPKLRKVNLSRNEIKVIPTDAFIFLNKEIKPRINLEGNQIKIIENGAFISDSIKNLNLKNNYLTDLYLDMFTNFNNGTYLLLGNNRFKCVSEKAIKLFKLFAVVNLEENFIELPCDKKSIEKKVSIIEW